MTSIDVCRLNKYDNPDLVYGRHDGTILKRLFSAFSFRPTTVVTLPVSSIFAYNPYSQNLRPTVTSIPMVNIRAAKGASMPLAFGSPAADASKSVTSDTVGKRLPTPFTSALQQVLGFIEGDQFVNRVTKVMYSREVLVFYVDRRTFRYNIGTNPVNVTRLPTAIAGFEHINTDPLTVEEEIDVDGDKFELLSVVCAKTNDKVGGDEVSANYVIGSETYLFNNDHGAAAKAAADAAAAAAAGAGAGAVTFIQTGGTVLGECTRYDPMKVASSSDKPFQGALNKAAIITGEKGPCATNGIIYIYKNFSHSEKKTFGTI
jgi:hypothetical protein